MKQRSELKRKTPMSRGTSVLKSKSTLTRGSVRATGKPRQKAMKSKQRAVTAEEKVLWDRLAALGCVACMREGIFEPDVSIHHVDGRTKPGCHQLVLPLCASHHQDGTGKNPYYVAVHPWKARFEKLYGTQEELMAHCAVLIEWRK